MEINTTSMPPKVFAIITATAEAFDVTFHDLINRKRTSHLSKARIAAMALCREKTYLPLQEIGTIFDNRDHATVMHAVKRMPEIETCKQYAATMQVLRLALTPKIEVSRTSVHNLQFKANFLKSNLTSISGSTRSLTL